MFLRRECQVKVRLSILAGKSVHRIQFALLILKLGIWVRKNGLAQIAVVIIESPP